jgi:hypothetical protein
MVFVFGWEVGNPELLRTMTRGYMVDTEGSHKRPQLRPLLSSGHTDEYVWHWHARLPDTPRHSYSNSWTHLTHGQAGFTDISGWQTSQQMDILHNTIYVQTPPLLQDLGSRGIRLLSIPDPAESGTHRSQNKQTQNLIWRCQIPRG